MNFLLSVGYEVIGPLPFHCILGAPGGESGHLKFQHIEARNVTWVPTLHQDV